MAIPFLSNVDFNQNEAKNLKLHINSGAITDPAPLDGQIFFDSSDNKVKIYHTNAFHSIAGDITGISITAGNGLTGTVSTTLGDHTQTIDVVGGDGITANTDEIEVAVDDTTIELSATDGTGVIQAKTAAVGNGGAALATGDQIYDFTYGNFLPLSAGVGKPLSGDLYITHDNADIILGNANAANTANRIEGLGQSGKTFIQFGFNQNDGGDEYQRIKIGYNGGAGDYTFLSANVEEEDLAANGIKSGSIGIGSGITNFVVDTISLNAGTVTTSSNLIVAGNLTVNGTTTTVNSTTVTIDDPVFTLGGDTAIADDSKDRGIEFNYNGESQATPNVEVASNVATITKNAHGYHVGSLVTINGSGVNNLDGTYTIASVTTNNYTIATIGVSDRSDSAITGTITVSRKGFFGYDDSANKFTFLTDATNTNEVFTGTKATIIADLDGNATNITTSASTAVAGKVELATADETKTGTDTARAVTPDSLAARTVVATIDVSNATLTGQTAPFKATIRHLLFTKDLIVQLQDVTTFEVINADISTTDFQGAQSVNHITIGFDNALPTNDVRVIITSGAGATSITPDYVHVSDEPV